MVKKVLIGGLAATVVLVGAMFFWARSILTSKQVRTALAAQVEKAIGQPVSIGSIDATIVPRVTVTLGDVTIGGPDKVAVAELKVGTSLGALFSRRIEHASLRLAGGRIALPLPPLTIATSSAPSDPAAKPPLELVSVDEIVLSDVEIRSGGRTLRGDVEIVPEGQGLVIRRVTLAADGTTIDATGRIASLAGPVGAITLKAGALDMNQLLAFVNDFTAGAGIAASGAPSPGASPPASSSGVPAGMNIALSLEADRASIGGLTFTTLAGTATITSNELVLDPVSFGIFGGRYEGALTLVPGETLRFRGRSALSNVDVAAAAAFAGSPDTISGRLSGRIEFAGSGSDATTVARSVTGQARVDITDGVVKQLGLVNAVVVATSMRAGSLAQAAKTATSGSNDEPFSKLGATIGIAGGSLRTNDLVFESKSLVLQAEGAVHLPASTLDLRGRMQLSDALSQQAARDLLRYTQDQGRVTLPVLVSGSFSAPSAKVDAGDMAKRALRNAANEQKERAKSEATKAVSRKLGGMFRR